MNTGWRLFWLREGRDERDGRYVRSSSSPGSSTSSSSTRIEGWTGGWSAGAAASRAARHSLHLYRRPRARRPRTAPARRCSRPRSLHRLAASGARRLAPALLRSLPCSQMLPPPTCTLRTLPCSHWPPPLALASPPRARRCSTPCTLFAPSRADARHSLHASLLPCSQCSTPALLALRRCLPCSQMPSPASCTGVAASVLADAPPRTLLRAPCSHSPRTLCSLPPVLAEAPALAHLPCSQMPPRTPCTSLRTLPCSQCSSALLHCFAPSRAREAEPPALASPLPCSQMLEPPHSLHVSLPPVLADPFPGHSLQLYPPQPTPCTHVSPLPRTPAERGRFPSAGAMAERAVGCDARLRRRAPGTPRLRFSLQ